jgi:streptogramin lyase
MIRIALVVVYLIAMVVGVISLNAEYGGSLATIALLSSVLILPAAFVRQIAQIRLERCRVSTNPLYGGTFFIVLAWGLFGAIASQASANGVVATTLPRAAQGRNLITGPDGAIWFNGVYSEGHQPRSFIGRIGPNRGVAEYPLSKKREAGAPIVGPGGDIWAPVTYGYGEPGYGLARLSMTGRLQEYTLGSSGTDWIKAIAATGDEIWAGVVLEDEQGYIDDSFIERIATQPEVSVEQRFPLSSECEPTALIAVTDAIWFAEVCEGPKGFRGSIARIGPEGETARYPLRRQPSMVSLAGAPDGSVWFGSVSRTGKGEFGRIAPTGAIASYRVRAADTRTIAIGPEGRLWFRSSFGGSVYRALRSIGPRGNLSRRICTGPKCGLEADGLLIRPNGEIWFSATEAHPPPGGGGGTAIGEDRRREEEAGVLGRLAR